MNAHVEESVSSNKDEVAKNVVWGLRGSNRFRAIRIIKKSLWKCAFMCLHEVRIDQWPGGPEDDGHHNQSLSWLLENNGGSRRMRTWPAVWRTSHRWYERQTVGQSVRDLEVPNGNVCIVILGNVRVAAYDPTVYNIHPRQRVFKIYIVKMVKGDYFRLFSIVVYVLIFPRVYKPGKVPISVLSLDHAINGVTLRLLSSFKAARLAKRSSS